MWKIILVIVVVIGAIVGFFASEDGERGEGAMAGAVGAALGCGHLLFQIAIGVFSIWLLFWLFGFLFG